MLKWVIATVLIVIAFSCKLKFEESAVKAQADRVATCEARGLGGGPGAAAPAFHFVSDDSYSGCPAMLKTQGTDRRAGPAVVTTEYMYLVRSRSDGKCVYQNADTPITCAKPAAKPGEVGPN